MITPDTSLPPDDGAWLPGWVQATDAPGLYVVNSTDPKGHGTIYHTNTATGSCDCYHGTYPLPEGVTRTRCIHLAIASVIMEHDDSQTTHAQRVRIAALYGCPAPAPAPAPAPWVCPSCGLSGGVNIRHRPTDRTCNPCSLSGVGVYELEPRRRQRRAS